MEVAGSCGRGSTYGKFAESVGRVGTRKRVTCVAHGPTSPPTTSVWFDDDTKAYFLENFVYLLKQQMSNVNRHSEITEVWVNVGIREVQGFLMARRRRVSAGSHKGPWRWPYHARNVAVDHWLSAHRYFPPPFAPMEVDFKQLASEGSDLSSLPPMTSEQPPPALPAAQAGKVSSGGTRRHQVLTHARLEDTGQHRAFFVDLCSKDKQVIWQLGEAHAHAECRYNKVGPVCLASCSLEPTC